MNNKQDKRPQTKNAIELAILNGIEAYNREQAKKQGAPKSTGETRTAAAMEEAGLKPRRRSRAKGKGTRLPEPESSMEKTSKAAKEVRGPAKQGQAKPSAAKAAKEVRSPAPQGEQSKSPMKGLIRKKKKQPIKVLFFGGVGRSART